MRKIPTDTRALRTGVRPVGRLVRRRPKRRLRARLRRGQRRAHPPVPGERGAIDGVAFSPDGDTIATGGDDGSIRLFDADRGTQLLNLPAHPYLVTGLGFNRDGTRLVSASPDGVVRVWALDLYDLIRIARTQVTRELSDDECRQYLHQTNGCV